MSKIIKNENSIPTYFRSHAPFLFEVLNQIDFEVGCHRLEYYAVCFLTYGELEVETDIFHHHVSAPAMFVIAPEVIRKFYNSPNQMEMRVLFFRKSYFLENQVDVNLLDKFSFFERKDQNIIPLTYEQSQKFRNYYMLIEDKINESSMNTPDVIRSFIYIILNEINDIVKWDHPHKNHITTTNEKTLYDFKILISDHFMEERKLDFYANKLHMTAKHLSTVIKQTSGKTASEWIKDLLLLESKVLLKDNKLTISEIACKLGFTDLSHFGKFFKNHTGKNPLNFRTKS